MAKTWLIIGIIVTSLSLIGITVFTLSNFILKRIYKDEEKAKTKEQKQKDKTVKRVVKVSKKVIKFINKKLVVHYLAFYGISVATLSLGSVAIAVSSVTLVKEQKAMDTSETSIVEPSSEDPANEPSSSENTSSEALSSEAQSSSIDISSEPQTSSEPETSSEPPQTSSQEDISSEAPVNHVVNYYVYQMLEQSISVVDGHFADDISVKGYPGDLHVGWSLSMDSVNPPLFDFTTPITEDIELYAVFEDSLYVLFSYDDGIPENFFYDYINVAAGENIKPLKHRVTINDELVNVTWYYDNGTSREEFDFNTPITSSIDLIGVALI